MKTIVFIRQTAIYYDSRAIKTIQTLSKNYSIKVLGWDRDGFGKEKVKLLETQNVEYYLFNKKMPHGSGIKTLPLMLHFFLWAKKMLKKFKQIDFIHCCDLDGVLGVFKYIQYHRIPLVYDIYDYYTEAHTGIPKIMKIFIQCIENKVIQKARVTIICTEQRMKQIEKAKAQKVVVIHNTPDISIMLPEINKDSSKIKLCFIGALAEHRLLLEIAESIKYYPEFEILFGGNGELYNKLKVLAENNNQIKCLGTMDYSTVLEYENSCDLLFAIYSPEIPNHKYCAPNKIYEAMALQKPIIVCKDTGIDELVENEGIGVSVNYSATEFFECAKKILSNNEKIVQIKNNCKKAYNEKYSWKIMSEKLLKLYEDI